MDMNFFLALIFSLTASFAVGRIVLPWQKICYQDVGCFNSINTFSAIFQAPDKPEDVGTTFFLFSRSTTNNTPAVLDYLDNSTLNIFDGTKRTIFITHGSMESSLTSHHIAMRQAILKKFDFNVIMVDWAKGAGSYAYIPSAINTQLVGRQIARLVQLLNDRQGLSYKSVHLVGLSLGGETSGFAGKWLRSIVNDSVARITGLDPAGVWFQFQKQEFHLHKEDADFVDVIHCSAGKLPVIGDFGILQTIGHVDFYPNGGRYQPRCSSRTDYLTRDYIFCSHETSVAFFTESIANDCPFTSNPCPEISSQMSTSLYWTKECVGSCGDNCGRMGYYSDLAPGRGPQYLVTNNVAPC